MRRGEIEAARRGLEERLAANDMTARGDRAFLLPVLVTACLAAGDRKRAQTAAEEMAEYAHACGTDAHRAAALQAEGEIALHDGDAFGTSVNLAARVCGAATAGELLCTDDVLAAAGSGFEVLETRRLDLKGVSDVVAAHVVHVG